MDTLTAQTRRAKIDAFKDRRRSNDKGQFVLPEMPAGLSPALSALIEEYRAGFVAVPENEHPSWPAAAAAIYEFAPTTLADLTAKMIIAIHYRDPEGNVSGLAIEAHGPDADRLAVEMELSCVDWLLARVTPIASRQTDWDAAEQALADAEAALEALSEPYTNEEVDQLADVRGDAIDAIMDLPTTTVAQALRKIELAMFDGTMVRTGVDFPALLAEAKRFASVTPVVDPVDASDSVEQAWASFCSAFKPITMAAEDDEEQRFNDITDAADDVLANTPADTLYGVAGKLRRVAIATNTDLWVERLAIYKDTDEHRRELELADTYTRMLWGAIDDIERIALIKGAR